MTTGAVERIGASRRTGAFNRGSGATMMWQATTQTWRQTDLSVSWQGASGQQSVGAATATVIGPATSSRTPRSAKPQASQLDLIDIRAMTRF